MKKKAIIITTVMLLVCGVAAICISAFLVSKKSADTVQQENSVTEIHENENSAQKEEETSVSQDTSKTKAPETEVQGNSSDTQTEELPKENCDNEAEIPENWGE